VALYVSFLNSFDVFGQSETVGKKFEGGPVETHASPDAKRTANSN